MESYITFSVGQLQFLDSMQFTNASLEKLAITLSREELMPTRESFTNATQFDGVRQKGVYPYDDIDSFNQFDVVRQKGVYPYDDIDSFNRCCTTERCLPI